MRVREVAPILTPILTAVSYPFAVLINKSLSMLILPFSNSSTTVEPPNLK